MTIQQGTDEAIAAPDGADSNPGLALGRFCEGLRLDDVPSAVRQLAKQLILDGIGVATAGTRDGVIAVLERWLDVQGPGPASVLGGRTASAQNAAFANGVLMHVLDFDDMGYGGHGTSAVLPAVLALGEQTSATGREILAAYIVGMEVHGKIGQYEPRGLAAKGWHSTSVHAILSAPAGAARMLRLDAAATMDTIALGVASGAGVSGGFGSMVKGVHAGHAAASAVRSAQLAAAGLHGRPDILDSRNGYGATYHGTVDSHGTVDWAGFASTLGNPFRMEAFGPSIKQYACCGGNHRPISNLHAILTEQRLDSGQVAHVAVHVDPKLLRLLYVGWPRTPYEAKFCLRFNLAATLAGYLPDVQLSVDAPYDDPVLTEARDRVEIVADRPGQGDDVEVVVTTTDGRQFTRDSTILHGSARDRMSEDEVFAKFERSVSPVVPQDIAESLRDAIMRLDEDASDGLWDTWKRFTAAVRVQRS